MTEANLSPAPPLAGLLLCYGDAMNLYVAWLRTTVALFTLKSIALGAIREALAAPNYKAEKWAPPLIVTAGIVIYYLA